ncbi:hypothetical protein ADEAN_000243400 [Angomonas deanei]|uniref:Uncharacterized protein n=1 Tax=Angomonas deanei TaxID=59799 RepID=A0A7G2C7G8_9TRYP|nr:hypothetical protein ADEAN_000243400 [Angomonas deanei]
MQPIFEIIQDEVPTRVLDLPEYVKPLKQANKSSKKREREDTIHLSPEDKQAIQLFFEYGMSATPAAALMWRQLPHSGEKPNHWKPSDSPHETSTAFWERVLPQWRILVRQAMLLLCEIARNDTTQVLTNVVGGRTQLDSLLSAAADPSKEFNVSLQSTLLTVYCLFSSIDLSLEDGRKTLAAKPKEVEPLLQQLCSTAEYMCDHLEEFVLELILSADAKDFAALKPLVEKLPRIFAANAWPCRLLATVEEQKNFHWSSSELLADKDVTAGIGGGITSILLRFVRELERADVTNVLASSSSTDTAPKFEKPFHLGETDYQTLLSQIQGKQLSSLGVRRAYTQFRFVLKGLDASKKSVIELQEKCKPLLVSCMRNSCFHECIPESIAAFEKHEEYIAHCTEKLFLRKLSPISSQAHAVLQRLRSLDNDGWFTVPSFDMVNMDFTSIAFWLSSPLFALKSSREVFEAISNTFEGIVDTCIAKYGPSNRFSQKITEIRNKVVIASRAEKLL